MKKKVLKALLCASLIFNFQFLIFNSACAQDSVFPYSHQGATLYYIIDSAGDATVVPPLWPIYDTVNDASWTGYTQPSGAVTVPDSVPFGGTMHAVTEVGHDAFYHCELVTSVTLPEAVIAIGEWAFGKCHGLTSFTLPASVTAISPYAFARCYGLTSVTIPEGVTEIPVRCFYKDSLLAEVNLPAGLTCIGDRAFADCPALQTINFPDSLRSIGDYAFEGCAGPALVNLPAGLTTIGECAFRRCDSISAVVIPGSVHTISRFAFANCDNLHFVQLGEGVDTIGYAAFLQCGDLLYINYPSTLTVIDSFAFQYDSSLSSNLVLPEGFTTMGTTVFGDNQSLTTISLPGTMTTVPWAVFWGCTNLSKVTLGEGIATIGYATFAYCPNLHSLTLPASLDSIAPYAFYDTQIDTLVFRGSVPPATTVDDSILNDYHTLLVVPQGSTAAYRAHPYWGLFMNIAEVFPYTYQGTTLYYIVDAEGLPGSAGDTACDHSGANASVVPPLFPVRVSSSVSDANVDAWEGYTKPVGAVTVPDSVPYLGTMHAVTAVADQTFRRCDEITSVALPASVRDIGAFAFYSCHSMQSVNIPDGVSRIPYGCFAGCYAMQSVDVPASVSVIEQFGFLGCLSMQSLTLHQGLDTIGRRAFCRCLALEHITLPDGLRVIDLQAFEQDTNLRRIDLPSSLEVVGGDAFRSDTHLDSVIFPEGLTYLGGGALMECSGLTYVHLPQNLELMQPVLLYGTGLESFVVPPHVQTIAYEVFAECPRLHKVTLPASVTTLYWGLFDNSPLDTLLLECTVPPALIEYRGRTTFSEYTATLIVPCGSADAYRADTVWGQFTNIIEDCTGIENVDPFADIKVYANHGRIVVEGTTDEVLVYDMMGRQLATAHRSPFTFHLSTPGVYLVKVGDRPAQKVVVMR